jgi:hypothetical protein
MDSVTTVMRQRIAASLTAALSGAYTNNQVLGAALPASSNGHTIQAGATLQQQFGPNLSLTLGYIRLHQTYPGVQVLSNAPDTNRESVSLSYQFSRPLGR